MFHVPNLSLLNAPSSRKRCCREDEVFAHLPVSLIFEHHNATSVAPLLKSIQTDNKTANILFSQSERIAVPSSLRELKAPDLFEQALEPCVWKLDKRVSFFANCLNCGKDDVLVFMHHVTRQDGAWLDCVAELKITLSQEELDLRARSNIPCHWPNNKRKQTWNSVGNVSSFNVVLTTPLSSLNCITVPV
jgi:hypothetical protein